MIHTEMPVDRVAEAVKHWIPGFRVEGTVLKRDSLEVGDTNVYNLRCTRNEMIDDFEVTVEVRSEGNAAVTVKGKTGTETFFQPVDYDGFVGSIRKGASPVAIEEIPTALGNRVCQVNLFTGERSCIAWICDGIAYRTVHDAGGYRLMLDIVSSPML